MTKLSSLKENLQKANQRLKEVLELEETQLNQDATIQRFEFCFELSWKLMQEYVRDQGFDCNSPKSCIRQAGQINVLNSIEDWLVFLQARNSVAHIYNEEMAKSVYLEAKKLPKLIDEFLFSIDN